MLEYSWGELTAEKYDNYTKKYSMYKETSKFLVDLADIKKGMKVIDLACGTGVTSSQILSKLDDSGELISIDSSKEMLNVAVNKLQKTNIRFIHSPAEKIVEIIKEKIDLILCNSAFWQLDMEKVLQNVNKILKNSGKFIFNIPEPFYEIEENKDENTLFFKIKEIANKKFNLDFSKKYWGETINKDYLSTLINKNGFSINSIKILNLSQTYEDLYNLLLIPNMTKSLLKDLEYPKRIEILNEAYNQLDKKSKFGNKWIFFILSKKNSQEINK